MQTFAVMEFHSGVSSDEYEENDENHDNNSGPIKYAVKDCKVVIDNNSIIDAVKKVKNISKDPTFILKVLFPEIKDFINLQILTNFDIT